MKNFPVLIFFIACYLAGGVTFAFAEDLVLRPMVPHAARVAASPTLPLVFVRMEDVGKVSVVELISPMGMVMASPTVSVTAVLSSLVRMEDALHPERTLAERAKREQETEMAVLRPMEEHRIATKPTEKAIQMVRMEDALHPDRALAERAKKEQKTEMAVLRPMEDHRMAKLSTQESIQLVRMADMKYDIAEAMPVTRSERLASSYAVERGDAVYRLKGDGRLSSLPPEELQAAVNRAEARKMLSEQGPERTAGLDMSNGGDEEVFLELRVDGQKYPEIISARRGTDGTQVYLPLSVMMKQLGFPIDVVSGMGLAQGWFVEEKRTFVLDEKQGYVEIAGKRMPLPAGSVRQEDGDIYVSSAQFEKWFPVQSQVSWDELALNLKTTEILPEAARLARQKLWDRYGTSTGLPTGPRHELARAMFGWPSLKLDYGTQAGRTEDGTTFANTLGLQAQGNLLGMDSYLSLNLQKGSSGEQGLTGGTFRLSTDSISGTTLGALGMTHLELGDVTLPRVALLSNAGHGRGVSFHNKPVGFAGSLNQFELQGDGPAGWDVEVYQNDALLAFGNVENNGRYQFSQLDLRPGMNDFRIILYGPQGQKQEHRQSYYLGEGMIEPGKWVYEAGLTESGNPLISTGRIRQTDAGTVAFNSFYGLNRNLSLNLGAATGPMGATGLENNGATAGLRAAYGKSFSQMNVAGFSDGGLALSVRERYQLGKDMNIGAFYNRQASSTVDPMQANQVKGLEFADTVNIGFPLRYGLTVADESYPGKPNEQQVNAIQSWRVGNVSFNNSIGRRITPNGNRWDGGDLSFATRVKNLPLRGQLLYQPGGADVFSSALLSTQMRVKPDATLNLQGQYQPAAGLTTLDANLQREIGPLALGLQGSWQSNNSYQVGLNLGMQLAAQGNGPSWNMVPARGEGIGYGTADVVVYVDDNQNGQMDKGEETLEGVQIRNVRSGRETLTNPQGVARLTDLLPNTETLVQLVDETLPDIYLKADSPWHVLVAHQGYGGKVNIPVIRQGEIGGTVVFDATHEERTIDLALSNSAGKIVERTRTQLDGTFYFQTVPLGTYVLHAHSIDGKLDKSLTLQLTREDPVLADVMLRF